MQVRLSTLIIVDDGLYDVFLTVAIFQKIINGQEKIVVLLLLQILWCGYNSARHDLNVVPAIDVQLA